STTSGVSSRVSRTPSSAFSAVSTWRSAFCSTSRMVKRIPASSSMTSKVGIGRSLGFGNHTHGHRSGTLPACSHKSGDLGPRCRDGRKLHNKDSARDGLRPNCDGPPVLLYDPPGNRQSQTGTAFLAAGKGLEQTGQQVGLDSLTGVVNLNGKLRVFR